MYRIYFNRHTDAPQIWSVDEGTHGSEINIQQVIIRVPVYSAYDANAQYPEPKAWLVAKDAVLRIKDGKAYLEPASK